MKKLLGLLGLVILLSSCDEFDYHHKNDVINIKKDYEEPVKIELNIKEVLENSSKHTIDSVIIISGGLFSKQVSMRNRDNMYGRYKKNFNVSKNNIKKAIKLLENEEGLFKIDSDVLDYENSFSLHCGITHGNFGDFYLYYDAYTINTIEAENKADLIKKLKFILENVYVNDLKYDSWEVTEIKNDIRRKYFR